MSEHCCWPRCQLDTASRIYAGGKTYQLCDKHGDLVQSEDAGVMKRARKKIKMPLPETINGAVIWGCSDPRNEARCAVDGCGSPMSLVVYTPTFPKESGGVPVCSSHTRKIQDNDIKWDGVWQRFLPGCRLDYAPLFEENSKEEHKETKMPEEVREEKLDEYDKDLVDSLVKRLENGLLDP